MTNMEKIVFEKQILRVFVSLDLKQKSFRSLIDIFSEYSPKLPFTSPMDFFVALKKLESVHSELANSGYNTALGKRFSFPKKLQLERTTSHEWRHSDLPPINKEKATRNSAFNSVEPGCKAIKWSCRRKKEVT